MADFYLYHATIYISIYITPDLCSPRMNVLKFFSLLPSKNNELLRWPIENEAVEWFIDRKIFALVSKREGPRPNVYFWTLPESR